MGCHRLPMLKPKLPAHDNLVAEKWKDFCEQKMMQTDFVEYPNRVDVILLSGYATLIILICIDIMFVR